MPEKVELPINIEKDDLISPKKPAFKWLGFSLLVIIFIITLVYSLSWGFSYYMIHHLSIEREKEIFGKLMLNEDYKLMNLSLLEDKRIQSEFDGYEIYVSDEEIENAFATLGANIIVTKGLLENIESKEELLFILGHEKQHILNRDVMRSMTKEVPITTVLATIGLDPQIGNISATDLYSSYMSRDAEKNADKGGIHLLNKLEMNTACATDFFERNGNSFEKYVEFSSTHPESQKRLRNLEEASKFPRKKCSPIEGKVFIVEDNEK